MKRTVVDRLTPEQKTIFARAWTAQTSTDLDDGDKAILGRHAATWTKAATHNQSDPGEFYEALAKGGICEDDIRQIVSISSTPPSLARPDDDVLIKANQTDAGNAECLEHLHGKNLRFCHTTKVWHVWDGTAWTVDKTKQAERWMLDTVRARYYAAPKSGDPEKTRKLALWAIQSESAAKIEAGLRSAQRIKGLGAKIEDFDTNPFLVTAQNMTIDLRTGKAYDPKREDMITKKLGALYDPAARCPRWTRHLSEVFNSDAEMIGFVKRAMGYTLTGDTREQKLFLLHGFGANGKSVTLTALTKIFGEYQDSTPFDTFDADTQWARHDIAKMKGARLVSVIETNEDRRLNEARVKSLTGCDEITAEAKYQDPYNYRPIFKIWLAMNHLPIVRGTDRAIWRRILLLNFNQSFEGREDKTLDTQLQSELAGILNWLIEGAQEWLKDGLNPPASVLDATREYRSEMDLVGQWLDSCTVTNEAATCEAGRAYQSYADWCKDNGHYAEAQNKFARRMTEKRTERGIDRKKKGAKFFYFGFDLNNVANARVS